MISRKQLEEIAATVQGVPVFGCLPGSTAAEAGVRYGDIVLSVNGVRTPASTNTWPRARCATMASNCVCCAAAKSSVCSSNSDSAKTDSEALAGQIADGRYLGKSASTAQQVRRARRTPS